MVRNGRQRSSAEALTPPRRARNQCWVRAAAIVVREQLRGQTVAAVPKMRHRTSKDWGGETLRLLRRPRARLVASHPGGPGSRPGALRPLREELAGLGTGLCLVPGNADPGIRNRRVARREAPASFKRGCGKDGMTGAPLGAPSPRHLSGEKWKKACPGPPMIALVGRRTSVKLTSPCPPGASSKPIAESIRSIFTPGVSSGTSTIECWE